MIVAAQQQVTNEWWDNRRSEFDLYVSQLVIREEHARKFNFDLQAIYNDLKEQET